MRLAAVGFILPFAFLWNPAILGQGDGLSIVLACAGGLMAVLAIATVFEWLNTLAGKAWLWPMRALLLAGGGAALSPSIAVAITGLLICGIGLISVYVASRGTARS